MVRAAQIVITRARLIWMAMANGTMFRAMAMSGSLISRRTGLLTKRDAGSGSLITGGHGYPTNPGAGRHTITDAGFITETIGAGGLDRSMPDIVRYGRRRLFPLSALACT